MVTRPESELRGVPPRDVRSYWPGALYPVIAKRAGSIGVLAVLDGIGVTASILLALMVKARLVGDPAGVGDLWPTVSEVLPVALLVTFLVFLNAGLYARRESRAGFGRVLSALAVVVLLCFVFAKGSGYAFRTGWIFWGTFAVAGVLVPALRAGYGKASGRVLESMGYRRIAFLIGPPSSATRVRDALAERRGDVVAYEVAGSYETREGQTDMSDLGAALDAADAAHGPLHELIVTDATLAEPMILAVLEEARGRSLVIKVAPHVTELLAGRVRFDEAAGMPLLDLRPPAFAGFDWVAKRLFDVAAAAVIGVITLPLTLPAAAAIWLTSRGPVFYRGWRVGLGERPFRCWKFRTMYHDADQRQAELEVHNEADGALFKMADDPRITPVGRFLRRVSIDELPQLINVLRGQMSLVGPRPLPLRDFGLLADHHKRRYRVLPGLTGLWQISGRSNLSFDDLMRLDFYYLEHWTPLLDVAIILRTVPAIIARRGAV